MRIDVWSDVACPWCFVGKRRLEAALERFAHRDEVEVRWHSFELDSAAPARREGAYAEQLAAKYGFPVETGEQMIRNMTSVAAGEGLEFHFERISPGNTFDAHRLLHLALEEGCQDALKERLLRAYLTEGAAVSDHDVLTTLALEVGLDGGEVRSVLAGDRYADEVRADEALAGAYGISGVPFFVFENRYGVSGAQPAEVLLDVLEQVWAQTHPAPLVTVGASGPGCEGDSCSV